MGGHDLRMYIARSSEGELLINPSRAAGTVAGRASRKGCSSIQIEERGKARRMRRCKFVRRRRRAWCSASENPAIVFSCCLQHRQ
jgi:hypothetical protein